MKAIETHIMIADAIRSGFRPDRSTTNRDITLLASWTKPTIIVAKLPSIELPANRNIMQCESVNRFVSADIKWIYEQITWRPKDVNSKEDHSIDAANLLNKQ